MENTELQELWYEKICTDCHESLRIFNIYPDIKWDSFVTECDVPCERCASGDRATFIIKPKIIPVVVTPVVNGERQGRANGSANDGRVNNSPRHRQFVFTPSNGFYKTLGYLAKNASLYVKLLPKNVEAFHDRFFELKGYDPVEEPGVFCVLLLENDSSPWSNELSVFVELPSWKLDTGNIEAENQKRTGRATYNSTSWVWWLFRQGFNLGRVHNIEAIRETVPEWFKESFDEGYSE